MPTKTQSVPSKAPSIPPPRPRRPSKVVASASSEAGQVALAIAGAALDKKASNIEIIDLGGKADYADYLVVMTGGSDRHVRALSDAIQESLTQNKVRALSVEGTTSASWILLDYGNVVVHVFQEGTRALYDIEGLWLDAARVPVP
jgi:ribosome-associated protein